MKAIGKKEKSKQSKQAKQHGKVAKGANTGLPREGDAKTDGLRQSGAQGVVGQILNQAQPRGQGARNSDRGGNKK